MLTLVLFKLALVVVAPHAPLARADTTLRVLLVIDDTAAHRSLVRGVTLGAEEAAHTAALFGTKVELRIAGESMSDMPIARITAGGIAERWSLILAAGSSASCQRAIALSRRDTIPLLDVGCDSTGAALPPTTFLLAPDRARTPMLGDDSARVELWSAALDRFGGEQLNERYRRRFAAPMDSQAWTGWMALKIALDLALRSRSASGPALLRQLADPRTQFDGQKGRPLRFDPLSHRLMQPAYRVVGHGASERVLAEVAP